MMVGRALDPMAGITCEIIGDNRWPSPSLALQEQEELEESRDCAVKYSHHNCLFFSLSSFLLLVYCSPLDNKCCSLTFVCVGNSIKNR